MGSDNRNGRIAALMRSIEERVAAHGWTYQAVAPDGNDDFGWLHTIGLENRGHPELIVVGLRPTTAQSIIDTVLMGALEGTGPWPDHGDTLPGPYPAQYEVRVIGADPEIVAVGSWFVCSHAFRGSLYGLDALQVVWPGTDRTWPTESTTSQPLLGPVWW